MPADRRRLMSGAVAVAAAVISLIAFAPSSALAADFCVQNSTCAGAGGTVEPSVDVALAVAAADAAPDRVLVGPGTFTAASTNGFNALVNPVQIIGAGAGATTLTGPAGTDEVLRVNNPASVVSDLTIRMPFDTTPFTKIGLHLFAGSARRIAMQMDIDITPVAIGVSIEDGTLEDSTINMPTKVAAMTTAVQALGDTTVRNSTLSGKNAALAQGAHTHFERDRLTAITGRAISVINSADDIDASNTLIELVANAGAVDADTGNNSDAAITLRNVTIAGDGSSPDSRGLIAQSSTAHTASVTADSVIVRGVAHPITRIASAGSSNVLVSFSDFDPAGTAENGSGSVTFGAGNINADPQFADDSTSDFHLLAGSPAIDRGDTASFPDAFDLDGNARVLDATGSGVARRDIGAFEAPGVPSAPPAGVGQPGGSGAGGSSAGGGAIPAGALTLSGLKVSPARFAVMGDSSSRKSARVKHGTRFAFTLSREADVQIVIQRRLGGHRARFRRAGSLRRHELAGKRSIRFNGKLGRKFLQPGSYRALVTAVDAAGKRSQARQISFRIVRG